MIVLDTTILLYAVGADHPLAGPSRDLIETVRVGGVPATTTADVLQEFTHIRGKRRGREDAGRLARDWLDLLSPLLTITEDHARNAISLFERYPQVGAFDSFLAAVAIDSGAEALVSADASFSTIRELRHVSPAEPGFLERLAD